MGTAVAKRVEATDTAAINALLRQADTGDERAIAELRAISEATPALWGEFGDLARHARAQLVRRIAGRNEFVAEATAREVGRLRRLWAGEHPSPLEVALVERVAACWLYLAYAEGAYTVNLQVGADPLTWEQDELHRKRIEQAERRYLRAIKALAEVRRIQLPAVQVNVGARQINVAG